jgi:hypothetical protein
MQSILSQHNEKLLTNLLLTLYIDTATLVSQQTSSILSL